MYTKLRYILIATVLLLAYLAALVIYLVPYAWLVPVGIGIVMLYRQTRRYTAYGTARWADANDIPHMLEGSGLIRTRKEGRVRTCEIDRKRFAAAEAWLSGQRALWEGRADRLEQFVTKIQQKGRSK